MSTDNPEKVVVYRSSFGLLGIMLMLIACMHYGYSCSCAGCDLVDSKVEVADGR